MPWLSIGGHADGMMNAQGNVLGTHLHGLFDDGQLFSLLAAHIRGQKGAPKDAQPPVSMAQLREREFDRIASIVRASVNMDAMYRILRGDA